MAKPAEVGFEQWVSAAVKNLAGYFNFSGWRIEVAYKDESKDSDTCGTSEGCVYAETHVDSAYMTVHIALYKQAKDDFDEGNFHKGLRTIFSFSMSGRTSIFTACGWMCWRLPRVIP